MKKFKGILRSVHEPNPSHTSHIPFRTEGFPSNQMNFNIEMVRRRNVYTIIAHSAKPKAHTIQTIYLFKRRNKGQKWKNCYLQYFFYIHGRAGSRTHFMSHGLDVSLTWNNLLYRL